MSQVKELIKGLLSIHSDIPLERCLFVRRAEVKPVEMIFRAMLGGSVYNNYLKTGLVAEMDFFGNPIAGLPDLGAVEARASVPPTVSGVPAAGSRPRQESRPRKFAGCGGSPSRRFTAGSTHRRGWR